jgi:geranylgeranyl pyrophosphate synthase
MSQRPTISWTTPAQRRRFSRAMDKAEQRLGVAAHAYPGPLGRACVATLAAGGKRMRPLLTLVCARRNVELREPVLRAAAAVELLHMATLVHDDVLDRAALRRGRPTVVQEFGVELAVSVGDYLLARAFRELVGAGDPAAVEVLSATAVGLSEGEVLQREEAHDVTITQEAYERRCERKTAGLFSAACQLGAMLSGAGDSAASALAEYGRLIGLAFQVLDDILDFSSDEASTGKRAGTDVRDGTITLPLIFVLETRPDLGPLLAASEPDADTVTAAIDGVTGSDALQRARAVALGYIEQARAVLGTCPDVVDKALLAQVATRVIDRYS